jgi:hypothetical protein
MGLSKANKLFRERLSKVEVLAMVANRMNKAHNKA